MGRKRSLPLHDASQTMRLLVAWCAANGITARRTSAIQIKVGPFNCWPDAGTWNSDHEPKRKKGLEAFKVAVARWAETESGADVPAPPPPMSLD